MSFRKNVIANYISQIYVAIVGVAILPLYIKYMGTEAYGLVGFFSMLQAWFVILDLGLTPTISRETARFRGGVVSALLFRQLFRALALLFFTIAVIGGIVIYIFSDNIASNWLKFEGLSNSDVVLAIKLIGIIVAMRWMSGLYRGVILGSERIVWSSVFNSLITSLRFIGVFLSMHVFGYSVLVFFSHQLVVAFIELLVLFTKAKLLLPKINSEIETLGWSLSPIKSILKFSLTIAFTGSVWVMVTQIDKLILSGLLSLESYAYFTLAVLTANGVMILSGPVSAAIMPRMARLSAEQNNYEMIKIYRKSTQIVAVTAGSLATLLIIAAKPFLIMWTGDHALAEHVAPIIRLYAAGNLMLCMAAFSYYLQYAKGNLKYHLVGNVFLVILLVPSVIFAAINNGAIGAGYVWVIVNAVFLFGWVGFVHKKFAPNLHVTWLINDVLKIVVPSAILGWILMIEIQKYISDRLDAFLAVSLISAFLFLVSVMCSDLIKYNLKKIKSILCR